MVFIKSVFKQYHFGQSIWSDCPHRNIWIVILDAMIFCTAVHLPSLYVPVQDIFQSKHIVKRLRNNVTRGTFDVQTFTNCKEKYWILRRLQLPPTDRRNFEYSKLPHTDIIDANASCQVCNSRRIPWLTFLPKYPWYITSDERLALEKLISRESLRSQQKHEGWAIEIDYSVSKWKIFYNMQNISINSRQTPGFLQVSYHWGVHTLPRMITILYHCTVSALYPKNSDYERCVILRQSTLHPENDLYSFTRFHAKLSSGTRRHLMSCKAYWAL